MTGTEARDVLEHPSPAAATSSSGTSRWDRPSIVGLGVAVALAVAAWLPFLDVPLSPDEGGFLLLGQHWGPGSSLYGSYWVDRPPLLLGLFSLVARLGPVGHTTAGLTDPAVKLMGAVASGLAVLLAGVIAQSIAPRRRWAHGVSVLAALALVSSPKLGMPEANGELLAVPFVLLGVLCLHASTGPTWGRRSLLLTAGAGVAATCAVLVKQNVADVFVLAVVLLIASRGRLSHLRRRAGAFLGAATVTLVAALAAADLRGTTPVELFDAVVVFRIGSSAVISASASSATSTRMTHLVLASLTSGVAALLVVAAAGAVLALGTHRMRSPLARTRARGARTAPWSWAALAMAAWELCGVALGGSYWLHYLTGLLPGILLLLALLPATRRWRRSVGVCLTYVVLATGVVWIHHAASPATVSEDAQVVTYLRANAAPEDGLVVAFGHADIVAGSGLTSPYEYLWSLPVRVRDPRLEQLSAIMDSPAAPGWVVVAGDSLDSWGLDPTTAQGILDRYYVERATYGDWHIWQHRTRGGDR